MGVREVYLRLLVGVLLAVVVGVAAYHAFGGIVGPVSQGPAGTVDGDAADQPHAIPTQPLWAVTALALPAVLLWPIPSRVPRDVGRVARAGFLFGIGVYSAWFLNRWPTRQVEPVTFVGGLVLVLAAAFAIPFWMSWRPPGRLGASWPVTRAAGVALVFGVVDWAFVTRLNPRVHPMHEAVAVIAAVMVLAGLLKAPSFPRDGRYWEALAAAPLGWCAFVVAMVPITFPELLRAGPFRAFALPAAVLLGGSLAYLAAERLPGYTGDAGA